MKNLFLISILSIFIAFAFTSCKDGAAKSGPEYTSAYVCPMHCEGSGSDSPGKCPTCKMDYKKNDDFKASESKPANSHEEHHHDGHDHHHDHGHEGHNH